MKRILLKLLIVGALLAASCWRAEASGTWTPLVNQAPEAAEHMLLLTDGTVIVNTGESSTKWWRLTPDIHGSYVNGTWSPLSSMNYARRYYASQVMNNGGIFIAGGEYGANGRADSTAADTAEVWNSQSNTWSIVSNGTFQFADAISKLLPSGKIIVGCAWEDSTVIYDPVSNTLTYGPVPLGNQNETDWVQLPDESILTVDAHPTGVPPSTEVDRYIPSLNQWVHDTATPVDLFAYGAAIDGWEVGSFNLLPNGKIFAIGGASLTAIYTPSGSTNPGTWVQGPNIPNNLGACDAPAASMVNGKVLIVLGLTGTLNPPISFYEYDYVANTLTQVNGPTGSTYAAPPFFANMLALPDGSILFSAWATQCYVYQPDGTPIAAGKPSIQSLTMNSDGSYHLTGTGFNGISEGAKYGDDEQMDTNWPIVRVTSNVSGNVYYAKTFNWTPGVVATGTAPVATDFSFPAGLPAGTYSLVVVANGNSSDPVPFSSAVSAAAPTFSPPAGTYTSAQTVTITSATNGATIIYTTDGTTPSESGGSVTNGTPLANGGSVSIGTTTTLKTIAFETGFADSSVTTGVYTISVTVSSSNGFYNTPMSSSQSGSFTATFDASPSLSPSNTVIGLSKGTQTAYTGLSCIARFNTSGDIDAYNGTAYQAASVIPYAKALTYHFRMVVNVPANTYSVYVTPPGGSELTVGLNYKFRKAATSLDTWTIDVNSSPGGAVTVSNLAVGSGLQQVAPPSFSPGAGTYSTAQTVLINDSTIGSSIRYTTDGSTPSETAGTPYTGSISISTTTTLKAIAYKTGMTDSSVTIGQYKIIPPPSAPVFSPGAGTYTSAQTVIIMSSGATAIYYTTNGSTPTSSSTLYTGPIPISTSLTLEAIGTNSAGTSPVTIGQYKINPPQQVAAPTFNPAPGTYSVPTSVTITSTTSGATIAYTTDGTTPTESGGTITHGTTLSNGGSVTISVTCTLNAMAFESGMTDSTVTSGLYTIGTSQAAAPTFSPPAGAYQITQYVAITSATSGATIVYTTDGTTPTESGGTITNGTSLGNGGAVAIKTSVTIEAIAYENGYSDSPVTSGDYAITPVKVLYNFTASNNGGIDPNANLVQGSDGNFYGTTASGGSVFDGTVFKVTSAGVLTTLVSFNDANGSIPMAALVQGSDGNFYGTTETGGSASDGTVFKVTSAGVLTTLVSFNGANNGSIPLAALVQGNDGNFYGTTDTGGSANDGTVFKVTPAGVFTTLISFNGANGGGPLTALVQGRDGNFYGTTTFGGSTFDGTVFKMTPAGALTTLVLFDGTTNGLYPAAALVQGSDGNFYGTTEGDDGNNSYGTVFKLTPAGVLTTLVIFNGSDGSSPLGLVQGRDGNFYGTTSAGGSGNDGTVFEITPAGVLTTLANFYGINGSNPNGLILGRDGNFYGTAGSGGTFNDGVIFEATQVGAPTFNPGPGPYSSAQSVTITSATSGASIAYTTDGSIPTEVGGAITHGNALSNGGSVSIGTTCTLNALAFKFGLMDSPVASGLYTIGTSQVAAPTFSPPAGAYTSAPTVTITSATNGATLAYTLDGSTPTESGGTITHGSSLANGGAITINLTLTLKVLAFKTGMTDSTVTTGLYTIPPPAAPVFSPGAGIYTSAPTVTITSSGATAIYYTTNGSTPTSSSTPYTGPILISTSLTLEAIGTSNSGTSPVTTGVYTINSVTRSLTGSSSNGFHALALTSAQAGTFTATFDATPSASPENAVVGLSKGVATAYTGLSCIARFNTSGDIDAYNGTAYQAASTIAYAKNTAYHFRMVVNVPTHTYSVYVTPAGQSELTVGLNYAFRSTAVVSSLDTWNLDVNATPSGCSLTANNLNP